MTCRLQTRVLSTVPKSPKRLQMTLLPEIPEEVHKSGLASSSGAITPLTHRKNSLTCVSKSAAWEEISSPQCVRRIFTARLCGCLPRFLGGFVCLPFGEQFFFLQKKFVFRDRFTAQNLSAMFWFLPDKFSISQLPWSFAPCACARRQPDG